ncbi:hypothetical protein [Evansella clarkii]|jgi:adenine-specific DNA methylase|uniref:hypothetical protein n=1 Tax=Evansella clarkii TaxID=79879 RepID=UPI0009966FA7|nr:hypothetical protein [Evansella clarkii]
MPEKNKAVQKMAQRVLEGYDAVHKREYQNAKKLLEPLRNFLHQETKPNVIFLSYLAIAQIGSKDVDEFLNTYEELQKFEPKNEKEAAIKKRVDEMFEELMSSIEKNNGEQT